MIRSPPLRCHSLTLCTTTRSTRSICRPTAMRSSRQRITPGLTFACRGSATTSPSSRTWDDQRTDANPGCSAYPGGTCGIYTSVSGIAPNRILNIEWRAVYNNNTSQHANHELRLYEGGQPRFDVIYCTVDQGNTSATAGVQRDNTFVTQYFCNGSGGGATGGQSYIYFPRPCPTPTPPRPTPTPRPRPTPLPRPGSAP